MGLARTLSVALVGVDAHVVEVEVDVGNGLPHFILTALSDRVLKQVEHRVHAAVVHSGETWPTRKITVAISPAMVPKAGSGFDLAVAAALLAADERVPAHELRSTVVLGELTLGGKVRPLAGVLPAVVGAVQAGHRRFVVPRANLREARLVPDADVRGVAALGELCALLRGEPAPQPADAADEPEPDGPAPEPPDLADVIGQERGRRAVEVAAAGGHHLLLHGPPGTGKTMLAERLPGLLPELLPEEALEVTKIHSIAGVLAPGRPLITQPPFCAPHHSASVAAVVGGGSGIAGPGAVSLAHRGVLFLDEAPEFSRRVLDALRQPLETGTVTLARSGGVATYRARFLLVLAANPCPCSAAGRDAADSGCTCTPLARRAYQSRISGPFRDRVDLCVTLAPVSAGLLTASRGEDSATVRQRVAAARARAAERLTGTPWRTNAEVPGPVLRQRWPVGPAGLAVARRALEGAALSNRGLDRVLKVAWTLADLDGAARPELPHVEEALALRSNSWVPRPSRDAA